MTEIFKGLHRLEATAFKQATERDGATPFMDGYITALPTRSSWPSCSNGLLTSGWPSRKDRRATNHVRSTKKNGSKG
jgi:hypothetical protein